MVTSQFERKWTRVRQIASSKLENLLIDSEPATWIKIISRHYFSSISVIFTLHYINCEFIKEKKINKRYARRSFACIKGKKKKKRKLDVDAT